MNQRNHMNYPEGYEWQTECLTKYAVIVLSSRSDGFIATCSKGI